MITATGCRRGAGITTAARPLNSITLDTNVFPGEALIARADRLGISVAAVTVSSREVRGTSFEAMVEDVEQILETAVFDESEFEQACWASERDSEQLERALSILSNGSFPNPGHRQHLTNGQRRQLRDAMILCAHVRSRRGILVSNDQAFISDLRHGTIEEEFATRVMTVTEFEAYLSSLEEHMSTGSGDHFFSPDVHQPPTQSGVARLVHSKCGQASFRRVPPTVDASLFEIGRDTDGAYFTREPLGGSSYAATWSPASGKAACNVCWDGRKLDNEVFNLDTGEGTRE